MQRRALLSSTAVALGTLGTAGCLSDPGSTPTETEFRTSYTESTTTDAETTTSTTTEQGPIVVGDGDVVDTANGALELGALSLQSSFVEHIWPTWDAEVSPTGLFAVLEVTGFEEPAELFDDPPVSATADGEPVDAPGSTYAYVPGSESARLATPVPAGAAVETAAVLVEATDGSARYPLDDDLVERVRNPPSLSASLDVPESVEAGNDLGFEVAVENTGATAGTLAATTTHDRIHDRYWTRRTTVQPGATDTISFSLFPPGESGDELDLSVDWGLDSREETVTITGGTTTDGARRARADRDSAGHDADRGRTG